jgi:hypothetical protein
MKMWGMLWRFVTTALKPAVQMPNSDKLARFNLMSWGGLCVLVPLIMFMTAILQGWAWQFWIVVQGAMLLAYATLFIWSVEGYFYRRDVKHDEATRRTFDQIVNGM